MGKLNVLQASDAQLQHEVLRLRWELVRWRRLAGRLRRALAARRASASSGTFRLIGRSA
jgi:hypothetical protein